MIFLRRGIIFIAHLITTKFVIHSSIEVKLSFNLLKDLLTSFLLYFALKKYSKIFEIFTCAKRFLFVKLTFIVIIYCQLKNESFIVKFVIMFELKVRIYIICIHTMLVCVNISKHSAKVHVDGNKSIISLALLYMSRAFFFERL